MTTARPTPRLPVPLLHDYLLFTVITWAVTLVVTFAVAVALQRFTDYTGSIWQHASGAAVWFVAAVSGFLVYQMVPMLIAHGRTRRGAAEAVLTVMAAMTAVAAVLISVGFLIEHVVYGMVGWPREITVNHLFDSHTDVGPMLIEFSLRLAVWSVAGALVGASGYRWEVVGWLALLPAGLVVSLAGTDPDLPFMGFVLNSLPEVEASGTVMLAGLAIAGVTVMLALTWAILREIPLRNR